MALKVLTNVIVFQSPEILYNKLRDLAVASKTSISRVVRALLWDRYDRHSHHPVKLHDELTLLLSNTSPLEESMGKPEKLIPEPIVVRATEHMVDWLQDTAKLVQAPLSRLVRSLLWEAQAYNEADGRLEPYLKTLDSRDATVALNIGESTERWWQNDE